MKKIFYIPIIALAISGYSLHAMRALQAKQEQVAKEQSTVITTLLPEPRGAAVGDAEFYRALTHLKELEKSNIAVSWIDRALYAVQEIKKLERLLNKIRESKSPSSIQKATKSSIKNAIIAYAQAALTGYNNNSSANTLYKSNVQNAALFDEAYEFLKQRSGWWEAEISWYSTDT